MSENFLGTIKDIETGEGIINATIAYGDKQGVLTDNNGSFSIENPTFPLRLEISHLTYHQSGFFT